MKFVKKILIVFDFLQLIELINDNEILKKKFVFFLISLKCGLPSLHLLDL